MATQAMETRIDGDGVALLAGLSSAGEGRFFSVISRGEGPDRPPQLKGPKC